MSDLFEREAPPAPVEPVMPADVMSGQVSALVDVVGGAGDPVVVGSLVRDLGGRANLLLPVIRASEVLEFARVDGVRIALTESGEEFHATRWDRRPLLRDRLRGIEPFRTALILAGMRGPVTAAEVADDLLARGVRWHHDGGANRAIVREILMDWAVHAGLLGYEPRSGAFFSPALPPRRAGNDGGEGTDAPNQKFDGQACQT